MTRGETDVLERLRAGASQPKIAAELGNSVHTVRTVVRNIRAKFHACSVNELLCGIKAGVYTVVPKVVSQSQAFNLTSALGALERELRLSRDRKMRNVRLHPDEISALLNVAHDYQAAVEHGAVRSADIGTGTPDP